jgi:hypothetical protein
MIANIKLELWFLETAEMCRLQEEEGFAGVGAVLWLFVRLRRQKDAIGSRATLGSLVRASGCDEAWLWHVVTDFGLFVVSADGSFYSSYLRQSLGMSAVPGESSSRRHTRRRAPYSKDSIDSKDSENRDGATVCVCLDDTQPTAGVDAPAPETDYHNYEKYLKR